MNLLSRGIRMYWTGDSKWSFWHIWQKIPGEIIQGLKDNIPPCCVAWYTLTKLMTIIPTTIVRTLLKEKKAYGFSFDFYVMWRMFGGKFNLTEQGERTFEVPRFWKLQYFRCPACRLARYERKLRWDTGSYWDWCGPYKEYYRQKYRERIQSK